MNPHLHHLLYKLEIQKKVKDHRKIMIEKINTSLKVNLNNLNITISIIRDTRGSVAPLNHHINPQY